MILLIPLCATTGAGLNLITVKMFIPAFNVRLVIPAAIADYILVPMTVAIIYSLIGIEHII